MDTFYAEAVVVSTGQLMADSGLSAEMVARLRAAEQKGLIRDLVVDRDVDLVQAFRNPFG